MTQDFQCRLDRVSSIIGATKSQLADHERSLRVQQLALEAQGSAFEAQGFAIEAQRSAIELHRSEISAVYSRLLEA